MHFCIVIYFHKKIFSFGKAYTATLRLGIVTDTEDITGEVLSRFEGELPTHAEVESVVEKFLGKTMQVPPMYSALKVNGQKLYDLARQGVTVERAAREIEIFSIDCKPTDVPGDYTLAVECTGGTYIRTLCADIGAALGCGGAMAALRRDEACGISLDETYTLEDVEQMSEDERHNSLLPTERLFSDMREVDLPQFFEKLFRDGCPIYQSKIRADIPVGERVRICNTSGEFFALGESCEIDGERVIKSIKIFKL